ncbi:hypothetical protein MTO96_045784, partial [Rhipicephalus appendiculatus]
ILDLTSTGWPNFIDDAELKPFFDRRTQLTTHQDCLLWEIPVVVPAKLRSLVLQELHDGHPGDVSKGEENKDTFWEFSDATAETPTAAPADSESAPPVRRYPVRNRRAPDHYTPS